MLTPLTTAIEAARRRVRVATTNDEAFRQLARHMLNHYGLASELELSDAEVRAAEVMEIRGEIAPLQTYADGRSWRIVNRGAITEYAA